MWTSLSDDVETRLLERSHGLEAGVDLGTSSSARRSDRATARRNVSSSSARSIVAEWPGVVVWRPQATALVARTRARRLAPQLGGLNGLVSSSGPAHLRAA